VSQSRSEVAFGSCVHWEVGSADGCNTLSVAASVTGQPGHQHFELSGPFVQVSALTGQPDSPDTAKQGP